MRSRSLLLRALTVTGLALLLAVSSLSIPVPTASAADPVRVLVAGDSITGGLHGDYTWRYRLWREFQRQRVPVDFVGPYQWPYVAGGYRSSTYADPHFDHDHFAVPGARLRQQKDSIGPQVAAQHADVVVLASGLNDVRDGHSAATIASYLSTAIDNVRAANPNATIVYSPPLPINRKELPTINAKISAYDAKARDVVNAKNRPGQRVVLAPTLSGWTPYGNYVQDGVHLTSRGEFFLGNRIAAGLRTAGVLPLAPVAVPASVAWVRDLKPRLEVSGRNLVVRWDHQALTSARVWLRRRGGAWHSTTTTNSYLLRTQTPGATYDVRVQGIRRTMTSTNSSISTLRAPGIARVRSVRIKARTVTWTNVFGATGYRVKYRTRGSSSWHVRTVKKPRLRVRVAAAEVSAYNAFSSSAPTTGRRR